MNATEVILTRRSIRKYTNQKIDKSKIELLLKAAMLAPSARNEQPWHFVIVDHSAMLEKLADNHPYGKMLKEASHAILVCGDTQIESSDGYLVQDCTAAVMNILTAAHAEGLGTVWLGVYPRQERVDDMKKVLDLPNNILPLALISIGYPAETKPQPDRYKPERVHYNKW